VVALVESSTFALRSSNLVLGGSRLLILLGENEPAVATDGIFRRPPKQMLGTRIPARNQAVGIKGKYREIRRAFDDLLRERWIDHRTVRLITGRGICCSTRARKPALTTSLAVEY
jgi:hypothetical protein